jgi:hypothetical protein
MIDSKRENEVDTSSRIFQGKLKQAEYENYSDKLNHLADKVFEQGKKLGKRTDIKEYVAYKRFVSEFLNEYLSNSHKFSKHKMMDRRGRYRVFSIVKNINSELDNLAKDLLSDQRDNINALKRIDCIRGLILDMLI